MMEKKTVLVTAIGSFSAYGVISNLKKSYRVIGTDIYDRRWVSTSLLVDKFFQVTKAIDREEFVKEILDICKEESVDYIFPLTDIEVDTFNQYRDKFVDNQITLCMSSEKTISLCRDKWKTHELMEQAGFDGNIPTAFLSDFDVEQAEYPLILKPLDGRSSNGLYRIQNRSELTSALNVIENFRNYIVQKLISGNVVTVDICRNKRTGAVVCLPREELLRTLNGAGTSVYVFRDKKLEDLCKNIAELFDIQGTVNFEFIKGGEGQYYFLECNPRFSGGVAFSCKAGYDFINNAIRCFDGQDIDVLSVSHNQYIVKQYTEVITDIE